MAQMTWESLSEVVTGLILSGKIAKGAVAPGKLLPPYDGIVKKLQKKGSLSVEEAIEILGPVAYNGSIRSSEKLAGLPVKWVEMLDKTSGNYLLGQEMEKVARRLMQGDDPDLGKVKAAMISSGKAGPTMQKITDIVPNKMPYVKTGYAPIDDNFYGVPEYAVTLIAGNPGVGKTFMGLQLAKGFAEQKKRVHYHSLEMLGVDLAYRVMDLLKVPKRVANYIWIDDESTSLQDIEEISARSGDCDVEIVDYMDMAVQGENSEAKTGEMYVTMSRWCRRQRKPWIAFAQYIKPPNISPGALPSNLWIRYSRMAEITTGMILHLINTSNSLDAWDASNSRLPVVPGRGYILRGKTKFGDKWGGPGAAQVEWTGTGWGEETLEWFPLGE